MGLISSFGYLPSLLPYLLDVHLFFILMYVYWALSLGLRIPRAKTDQEIQPYSQRRLNTPRGCLKTRRLHQCQMANAWVQGTMGTKDNVLSTNTPIVTTGRIGDMPVIGAEQLTRIGINVINPTWTVLFKLID